MRPTRWLTPILLLIALPIFTLPAFAAEPACPLDVATCLMQFQRMKERPWLGVSVERDSLKRPVVMDVESGTPARRAGIRKGDILISIEGKTPADWFAGKAGWKDGDSGPVAVLRSGQEKTLKLRYMAIPEERFARIIGVHMIEGHLAHMHDPVGEQK